MPMPGSGLERPPLPAPGIQMQMGQAPEQPPGAGLGALASQRAMAGPQGMGAPNPNGATQAKVDAVQRVLEEIGREQPIMAPFAARAAAILNQGLSAVVSMPATPAAGDMMPAPGPPGAGAPALG